MLKACVLLALCSMVYYTEAMIEYEIMPNPPGYGNYSCPQGYYRFDLDYITRNHWTFMQWGSRDSPFCALRGTEWDCRKNKKSRKNPNYMTYTNGHAEFHIGKFTHFSSLSTGAVIDPSTGTSDTSGGTQIPVYFALRAIYFKVRGVDEMELIFTGDITHTIHISDAVLEWRTKTWICIKFEQFPIFEKIFVTMTFDRMRKAKLWDVYMFTCCEDLNTQITVGGK